MEEQPTVPVQSEYVAPKSELPCKESKWAQFLETVCMSCESEF